MNALLLFPPIVSTGFGSYYPSLPILSAYLETHGIGTLQKDLNQELAQHVLQPELLKKVGEGRLLGNDESINKAHLSAVAARIIIKNRSSIIDHENRLQPIEGNAGISYLLSQLCKTILIDESVLQSLDRFKSDCPICHWYLNFYKGLDLRNVIANKKISLVGISTPMGPQLLPTLLLAKYIKSIAPHVKIVVGGATFSLMPQVDFELMLSKCKFIDAGVRFEGENALLSLCEQLNNGEWVPELVDGVSCLVDNSVVNHRQANNGNKLDHFPYANYDQKILNQLAKKELSIVQTRGCYWGKCAYCDFIELYDGSPRYRSRSPEHFVEEIENQVERYNVTNFTLITEAIPPSFAKKFSRLVLEKGLKISWNSFAMVDKHFTKEHFELMRQAGCESLVIGLETMSDRVLKHVGKYASSDDNAFFISEASNAGIKLNINLIPNLPSTTYTDALSALEKLEALRESFDTITIFPFEATHSSSIGRAPEKYGLIPVKNEEDTGQAYFASNHMSIIDPAMNKEQLASIIDAYQLFADKVNIKKLSKVKVNSLFESQCVSYKIDHKNIDAFEINGEFHIFNAKMRKYWITKLAVGRFINVLSQLGPSIDASYLKRITIKNEDVGTYIDKLLKIQLLVPENE